MTATASLFDFAASLPDQIDHARKASRNLERLPDKERVENIVVLGMGDSGVAGDVLVATASPFVPVPITVIKGYELPAYVGEGSLVFAISLSGDTEEVIDAATDAAVQGAKIVVISSGGRLCELGGAWGATIVRVPKPSGNSGGAIGELAIPAIVILEDIGLFPGATQWIDLAVEQIENRVIELQQPDNIAEQLAAKLVDKLIVIHGGGALGAAAAQRWKTQINVNAQSPAFWSSQPELGHNEIAGWNEQVAWSKRHTEIVALRHDSEHPQIIRRFDLIGQRLEGVVSGVHHVRAQGDGDLAQLLDLFLIGDFVSLYMAQQLGMNGSGLSMLNELRTALSDR
jgi:glucose/mannose-6-phosphate isomerase